MKKWTCCFAILFLSLLSWGADINMSVVGHEPDTLGHAVKASTLLYSGDSVCTDSTGYAVPCADTSGYTFWGLSVKHVDNSSGSNGSKYADVWNGIFQVNFDSLAITNLGDRVYVKDRQTFAVSGTSNAILAGRVVGYIDSTTGWLDTRVAASYTPTSTVATSVSYADSNSEYGGTTNVDGALTKLLGITRGYEWVGTTGNKGTLRNFKTAGYVGQGDGTDYLSISHLAAHTATHQSETYCFLYDFSVLGGATGAAITLTDCEGNVQAVPTKFVVTGLTYEVITAFTSGGLATVKLGITGTDNYIHADVAFDHNDYSLNTAKAGATTVFKTSGSTSLTLTATTAALTAGKVRIYVDGHQGI